MSCSNNGKFPQSDLRPIAGGGYLTPRAAASWNMLAAVIFRETGIKIVASEAYRDFARQVYFRNLYLSGQGNLAAIPGQSNHGCGVAVDLLTLQIRALIDRFGAKYGWSKAWSDALNEWWHILYDPDHDQFVGKDVGPDYSFEPKKPSWWRDVKHKLKTKRLQRLAKKRKREEADSPERRAQLHKEIQALGREIDRLIERRKNA